MRDLTVFVQVIPMGNPDQAQWHAARHLCQQYGLAGARRALLAETVQPKNARWVTAVMAILIRLEAGYLWFRTFSGVTPPMALERAWAEGWASAFDITASYEVDREAEADGEWGSVIWTVYDGAGEMIASLGRCDEPMTDRDVRFERVSRFADAFSLWA
jgi:hypothetical protein